MKSLLKKIFRFCLTFTILMLVAEGVLQIIDFPQQPNSNTVICEDGGAVGIVSSKYHHALRPSNTFTRYPGYYDEFAPAVSVINELGMRGPIVPRKKKGEKRLLLVGDSFIQAAEIDYKETVGVRLQKLYGDTDSLRVIQHGVRSWSPLLEVNWIIKDGLALQPDHIVIFLVINDFYIDYPHCDQSYAERCSFDDQGLPISFDMESNSKKRKYQVNQPFYHKIKLAVLALNSIKNFMRNRSFEPQWSQKTVDYLINIDPPKLEAALDSIIVLGTPETENVIKNFIRISRSFDKLDRVAKAEMDKSFSYIEKLRKVLDEKGIGLTLTFVPTGWNINKQENALGRKLYHFGKATLPPGSIQDRAMRYCKEHNLQFLNLFEDFRKYKNSETDPLYLVSDGHLNGAGHRRMAALIHKELEWWISRNGNNNEIDLGLPTASISQ